MKKLFSLLLVLVFALSLTAYASSEPDIPVYPLDSSLNLSDSVLDGQVAIEGVVYQMPIAVFELVANGWTCNHVDEVLEPGWFGMIQFSKDGKKFSSKVINEYAESKTVSECHVVCLIVGPQTADVEYFYTNGGQLINVQFSSSVNTSTTKTELLAALGEPSSVNFLSWRGDNAKYINPGHKFSVYYNEDGTLNNMTLEYLPANFLP